MFISLVYNIINLIIPSSKAEVRNSGIKASEFYITNSSYLFAAFSFHFLFPFFNYFPQSLLYLKFEIKAFLVKGMVPSYFSAYLPFQKYAISPSLHP